MEPKTRQELLKEANAAYARACDKARAAYAACDKARAAYAACDKARDKARAAYARACNKACADAGHLRAPRAGG